MLLFLARGTSLSVLVALAFAVAGSPRVSNPLSGSAAAIKPSGTTSAVHAQAKSEDSDQTLRAMRDEMDRERARLETADLGKPYYIAYRLLDVDVRSVTANFGALVSSTTNRNRFMVVDVRMGDYHIDSSNFVTDEGFRGAIGSAGQVGIDRDYNSLRQDLWLATDQAYKQAADQLARKQAFLHSLARPPEIDDFSRAEPVQLVQPHAEPDWTSRNWEDEAKSVSSVFRAFSDFTDGRATYYMVYQTYYLLTSEGTQIRTSRSLAAIEANGATLASDGMPLHNFYSTYALRPADLPQAETVRKALEKVSQQLVALRASPRSPDYTGPVLFGPLAAGSLLAQLLGPSIAGARPPMAMVQLFDQMMDRLGGRSAWSGRVGTRVFPPSVSLVDDPAATTWQGQPLFGGYEVDEEGVRAQRVTAVENGILRNLLMSRRPGPDFQQTNGHGRAAFLGDPHPAVSNLFVNSTESQSPDELRKRFLDMCRADGHEWCIEVKQMDNPALAAHRQEDFNEMIAGLVSGAASSDRLPLWVYRVYVSDGHQELVRGAMLSGVDLRLLRSVAGVGNESAIFTYMQNPGFAGTQLAPFGSAQGGLPSAIVAPSLLLADVEVRGPHGESNRPPLVPAPPMN